MLSDSESELFITQSSFSGSRSIDLSENNFESLFADADNEKAVDNFNLRTEDLFTDVFTDKEDSGRGIITVSDREIQARSSILVIVAYLIFQINICKFVLHEQLI